MAPRILAVSASAVALLGAATAPAATAAPAPRGAHDVPERIVVQPRVGIAGVVLGDRAVDVRARLGPPVRTILERQGTSGVVYERWFYRGLRIGLIGTRTSLIALDAETTSPAARTPRGVGVGS